METKFIFVTGGVLSGLGKGILASSLGNTLKYRGYSVSAIKFDPYLNVDAGTLNPAEHGECFVTADGAETDLDLGHYERFLDVELTRDSSVMSGSIYRSVIEKERSGHYLGKTIQMIPHITNEIKHRLYHLAEKSRAEIVLVEIGGTVGDIEGRHFVEAIRQVGWERGKDNVLYAHLGYLPYLVASQEIKTKPVQSSINELRTMGIQPDLVFCRAERNVKKELLRKVALFGGLPEEAVIPLTTSETIYEVPLLLQKYNVDTYVLKNLNLKPRPIKNSVWKQLVESIKKKRTKTITIGLIGKYMTIKDTYYSVVEALKAATWATQYQLNIRFIDSELLEKNKTNHLEDLDGICVPGGFGSRGVEGIIKSIRFAREQNIPYLGLCFGMQLACVEFARNALSLADAHSTEVNPKTSNPIINLIEDQNQKLSEKDIGGTMRLGAFPCQIKKDTLAHKLYGQNLIQERHRHRWEFNNAYREVFEQTDKVTFSGTSPDNNLIEIIELNNHPFFIACQFHPEFKSRPNRPHPLFVGLINAVIKDKEHGGPTLL